MYQIGEIDFGIRGILDEYLKNYGYAGKKNIIDTLGYLIYEVEKGFREKNLNPAGNIEIHKNSVWLQCLLKYFKTGNAVFRFLTLEAPSFREGSIHKNKK